VSSSAGPEKGGEGGEGGGFVITNAEFLATVFTDVPEGASAVVCSKPGDPTNGGWRAVTADQAGTHCPRKHNNYVNCSLFFRQADGSVHARLEDFAGLQFLLLDDVGTKVPREVLGDFKPSWMLETSPGNFQIGILLERQIRDRTEAKRLLNKIMAKGLCDKGAGGASRWARLPEGINGKDKYIDGAGAPFRCRLVRWNPDKRYTARQIIDDLQLEMDSSGGAKQIEAAKPRSIGDGASSVFLPRAEENPVVAALKAGGFYKRAIGEGKHEISCPWLYEHTDRTDSGAAYFEPSDNYPVGGFCCQHSHRDRYHIGELLHFLNVSGADARHVPVIRVQAGELDPIVSAVERVLADSGNYFQYGGLIASVVIDPNTGDPSIVPANEAALVRELSKLAQWERIDGNSKSWSRCDPPSRYVHLLAGANTYPHLPILTGVARQPYFRESDGELVTSPGYDAISRRFGVFDPGEFVLPEATEDAARAALSMLEGLIQEFPFAQECDRSAALSAILTAVSRPTVPHAPAFHGSAPSSGSGKSYLCELIAAFAGPGGSLKTSYPATAEEATKSLLSLLLTGPAVIEFDDMVTDWIAHGTVNRMLTAEYITDRILGVSKVATVSTRTLILGSGNNVGPTRDLLRRVLPIRLDPRCSTPAIKDFWGSPVQEVRAKRGQCVTAALTIIRAWRNAGCPRANVPSIVTYGGAWADYCRFPLLSLGCADPATRLIEQVRHDPDSDALQGLMSEWHKAYGATAVTVRRVIQESIQHIGLLAALCELPVLDPNGSVNASRFGWFLKRNAGRIVDGYRIEQARADGRVAWRVVRVEGPASPPSPPSGAESETRPSVADEGGSVF
jgi:hypothetical protein